MHGDASRAVVSRVLDDAAANYGYGAALDCKEGLSPLRARPRTDQPNGELSAATAYAAIDVPLALWYGKQDPTVPVFTAEYLRDLVGGSDLRLRDGTHSLYFFYCEQILDDLISKMGK